MTHHLLTEISTLKKEIMLNAISKKTLRQMIKLCQIYLYLDMDENAFSVQKRIDHYTKEISES